MTREEQMSFLSKDGKTRIHAVRWTPEGGTYKAVLQLMHGMTEYIGRYRTFAEYMNSQGYLVVGHDHLGHGESITSESEWGYFSDKNPSDTVIADIHQLRMMVQKENPSLPYFMLGHSMGSYMLRKYLCIYAEGVSGAVIVGTGCVPEAVTKTGLAFVKFMAVFRGWHYRSRLMRSLSYSKPYHKYDLKRKDCENSWLSKNVENVREYYNDPRCTFIFTLNGYQGLLEAVLYSNRIENIRKMPKELPLFFVSGAEDPVGDLGEGVKKAYAMYQAAGLDDITYKLYENDRHEILNETDREQVFADIAAWLNVRVEL
ncbi:MAG: alpha/beta fold hydrolase [Clostridiales bacterium]|nr:alpha/beta fold hydrolase [Clostridiales bacterium]